MVPMTLQHGYQPDLSDKALVYAAQLGGVPLDRPAIANTGRCFVLFALEQ
jgi:hypothetical protein